MAPIRRAVFILAIAGALCAVTACSDRGSRAPEPSPPAVREAASPAPTAEPEVAPAPAPSTTETEAVAAKTPVPPAAESKPMAAPVPETASTTAPVPEAAPAAPPPAAAPATPPPAAAPATRIAVPASKPGLSRIGADKCKVCHKLQHESWAASKHATQEPPLDCESCHGPGSEYKVMSIMKDPAKAQEAGLVMPGKAFCVTCHQTGWSDDMLTKVHAHKE